MSSIGTTLGTSAQQSLVGNRSALQCFSGFWANPHPIHTVHTVRTCEHKIVDHCLVACPDCKNDSGLQSAFCFEFNEGASIIEGSISLKYVTKTLNIITCYWCTVHATI